jgi:NAD(P)-dependent dehydrogenase (short-subunit alcohol dehydrogenase family)
MAIALVTGTSTGIGFATALALARGGHEVYAAMRNPEGALELQTVAAKDKLPIRILRMDVDDDGSVKQAVKQVLTERRQIDVLVNNAGIATSGPVEELPLAEFKRTMETNLFGALRCIQAALPSMRERRRGTIVNITSVAGRLATASQGAYAASKFALEALSEALAQEVKAFNIRVAIVEPGVIQTPIFAKTRGIPTDTRYPHERRLRALFTASLKQPVPSSVVGEQIRTIVDSDSWQLRYPVGPDAVPFLQWRASLSDEAWVSFWATPDDEAWCALVQQTFGLDVRPYL